jgi:hypothetical protein
MLITPNFEECSDPIEPGTYKVRVTKASPGKWKTGTEYVGWEMETVDSEDPKNNGRKVFHKTPSHGRGAIFLKQFIMAANGEALSGPFNTEDLLGKELRVSLVNGTNQEGDPSGYMEVKSVSPVA